MNSQTAASSRLMIVNGTFPPSSSAGAILLSNVMASYPGEAFAAAWQHPLAVESPGFAPPCPVSRLWVPQDYLFSRIHYRLQNKAPWLWACRQFLWRQVRRHRPTAILAGSSQVNMFVGAFRVAQRAGLPFYAHMHDLWEENESPGRDTYKLAKRWEKVILTKARRVLCMTEVQADFYRAKYGVSPCLLPHAITPQILDAAPKQLLQPTNPRRTVLFVGSVSGIMNMDALRVLAKASELLPEDMQLLFLSLASKKDLTDLGIASSRLSARTVPREEVWRTLSASHVLIAPLSHKNGSADEVRTVFSTKLLEYLVSGRPILVFGPDYSFHVQSARKHGWGLVVDRDDPQALADGIMKILTDEGLAKQLVSCALLEAGRRDARVFARQLHDWVVEDSCRGKRDTCAHNVSGSQHKDA